MQGLLLILITGCTDTIVAMKKRPNPIFHSNLFIQNSATLELMLEIGKNTGNPAQAKNI